MYEVKVVIENGIEYKISKGPAGQIWRLNDFVHRENGPAIEWTDGYKAWYKYGKCHREDGPARILSDGIKEYWLNNIHYPDVNSPEELLLASIIL